MHIDVWSDFICPFCYMGEALLTQALDGYDSAASTTVRYRSYQLMPELESGHTLNPTDLLVTHRGMARDQAVDANAQVTERASSLGLDYRLDKALVTNTGTAHRLSHFAAEHGAQRTLVSRLFAAYFTEGLNIGDPETLAELAAESGLEKKTAYGVVAGDDYAEQVDADIERARQIGVTGVPFFVFNDKLAISGAQPVEAFHQALRQAE